MLTIILVAYKPDYKKLNFLLNAIDKKIKIIIINNSEDRNIIKNNLRNITVYYTENNGNGAGINYGLKKCKTKYALYMDLDITFSKYFISKFLALAKKIKDFGILVPNHGNLKGKKNIIEKYTGEGSVMFFNLKIIKKINYFDERFFLYYEEEDLFLRCKKNKIKVFFIKSLLIKHKRASSVLDKENNIKKIRSWHFMWSMFFFYKKNYCYFYSLKKTYKVFLKDIIIIFLLIILLKREKVILRFYKIYGLISSMLLLKSFLRP